MAVPGSKKDPVAGGLGFEKNILRIFLSRTASTCSRMINVRKVAYMYFIR